ncbi:MAG: iron-sulfur cluster-binding protein [Gammaproteobacteria bacterium]|nr:iron-sulfur cluster-binding protein [Gammaproteobacteria bacterium]MBU1414347.1 iron-sulfur cluster-binding protein [Gammaproteobacteria bacterium]
MSHPIQLHPSADFIARTRAATADKDLRKGFRGAMDFLQAKRAAQFPDPVELETLRDLGAAIRRHSLACLPDLLEQLEGRLTANGIQVHWAETPDEANAIVLDIVRRRQAKSVIKGKSMVSEEVAMNHVLEAAGLEVLESDMGEYIVQLAGEAPSHIIMPAIHKSKQQIAALFAAKLPGVAYTEDVDELIRIGRDVLRRKFAAADIGLSGVNFAVAETGTLFLVENEGNGRMCTTVPKVHVAITGIEKVVAKLEHVAVLNTLLPRSATGQAVETYQNFISGPRKPDELDGPEEVHLILLDNGRTQAYADREFRATLQCIRCGACMNHCPVYARIGGHAYGTTYPGPIGAIISPHLLGIGATHALATASTLCGACAEVCPVRIPIPQLLIRLRNEAQADSAHASALRGAGESHSVLGSLIFRAWALLYAHPAFYRMATWLMSRLRVLAPARQGAWTQMRTPLIPARRRLRDLLREPRRDAARDSTVA